MADETAPLLNSRASQNGRNAGYDGIASGSGDVEGLATKPPSYLSLVIPMSFGIFLAALDGTIVVTSYAAIGSELKQLQSTSWIATSYLLTSTSFQPLYGKLSDIFGRKQCLLVAYTIFVIGSLLCGIATTMHELIVARAIAGIGGGGMTTVVSIIMSDVVPLRERGTWQGVLNIVFSLGAASGAPLGGFLTDTIGWRWAFLIQVPIAILAILSVSFSLRLPKLPATDFRTKFLRIDFAGAFTLILAVFSLLLALDRGGNITWNDKYTLTASILFVALFSLFLLIELSIAKEPFAPKRIIANPSLIAAYLVNFFGMAAGMCTLFQVSLYFQAVIGKTASEASLWMILSVLGSLIGSLAGGLTIQASGKFWLITVACYWLLLAGSVVLVGFSGLWMRLVPGVAAGLFMISLANGGGITTSLVALIANAGQVDQAIATAVSYLFRSLGVVVGLSIGSTIVNSFLRSALKAQLSGKDAEKIITRVRESLSSINDLDPATQLIVRNSYEYAINIAFRFTVATAFCGAVASLYIRETALGGKDTNGAVNEVNRSESSARDGIADGDNTGAGAR